MPKVNYAAVALVALSLAAPRLTHATTYYVDSTAGSDTNAGTSRSAAWKTWPRMVAGLNAQTIRPGDSVLIRPGRYLASATGPATYRITGPGGTANAPITVSIDTSYPGDVEVDGAMPGNYPGMTTPWVPAKKCNGGTNADVPCDADPGCPGATCAVVPKVYWTSILASNYGPRNGIGVAFQPNTIPGKPPTIHEILYSPERTPIVMPAFTDGRNQCWPYFESPGAACTAARVPFACCTGAGTGPSCNGQRRMYVQTTAGGSPGAVSPEVHVEYASVLNVGNVFPGIVGTTRYVYFTNNNNGRTFYFWWAGGDGVVIYIADAEHIRFEDFDLGYQSASFVIGGWSAVNPWLDSGSTFPRNNGGPMYLIAQGGGGGKMARYIEWRRGKVHSSAGDEGWHISGGGYNYQGSCSTTAQCSTDPNLGTLIACNSGRCQYMPTNYIGFTTMEDLEVYDHPWAVPNGDRATYGYAYSWPPAGYRAAWSNVYATHFSPLGGGGQTPGGWIIQTTGNVIRRVNVHDAMQASFESTDAINNLVEDCSFDFALLKYAGNNWDPANPHPSSPVGVCNNGPNAACGGYGGERGLAGPGSGTGTVSLPGNKYRNNIFKNCYNACFVNGCCGDPMAARLLAPELVNNTFDLKGGGLYVQSDPQMLIADGWGTASSKAIIKNNIITRSASSSIVALGIGAANASTMAIDFNLWGPNMKWQWGGNPATTSFATWRASVQASSAGSEANSSATADPMFVSPTDLHIQPNSPARDAGTDMASLGIGIDFDGQVRPQGARWDIGADEQSSSVATPAPPVLLSLEPLP